MNEVPKFGAAEPALEIALTHEELDVIRAALAIAASGAPIVRLADQLANYHWDRPVTANEAWWALNELRCRLSDVTAVLHGFPTHAQELSQDMSGDVRCAQYEPPSEADKNRQGGARP